MDSTNLECDHAAELATASLAASEIEGDSADARAAVHHAAPCANCQTRLSGPFCHACGQRAHVHRSLLHLGEEVLHGLLHFDAKAWRTLPLLIARPGQLTRRYIDGQRTRFVSPLALFLFMMFFMFFVVTVTNQGKAPDKLPGAAYDFSKFNVDTGSARVDGTLRHAMKNPELTAYKLKNGASRYSFLLVPISLPFLWLMFFWKRGITMYDHAVFTLYSLSFMALLAVVAALSDSAGLEPLAVALMCIAPPLHMFAQLRGAYALGLGSALWRTFALMLVATTVFLLYLLLILVLSVR